LFDNLNGVEELSLVGLIRVSSLSQGVESCLSLVNLLWRVFLIFDVKTNQFDNTEQIDAIQSLFDRFVITMSLNLGMHGFGALLPYEGEHLLAILGLVLDLIVNNLLCALVVADV
jgi:hypothetical protein